MTTPKPNSPFDLGLTQLGTIHIIGIGGIGMSGIAEILHSVGCVVQGSDMSENANVQRLRDKGIKVFVGHEAENVQNVAVVVKSTAVKATNPEVVAAQQQGTKVIHRAEMLAEIMKLKNCISIAGTHGKTTTTTMMATLFESAKADPCVLNGGVINAYGSNAKWGKSDWLIVEADESDGTFVRVPSTIGVITNIDPEHMEHYGSFDVLKQAFRNFVEQLPFYGFAVMCADHDETAKLAHTIESRKVLTYGVDATKVDARASNLQVDVDGTCFDVTFSENVEGGERTIQGVRVNMPGHHNVLNALAVLTVGAQLGLSDDVLRQSLAGFQGVQRRFTKVGEVNGISIIDDYAHHPVEINATLKAARGVADSIGSKVIAVMQPHRYTRLSALFDQFVTCFDHADKVLISDVYEAGEPPIEGADKAHLVAAVNEHGVTEAVALANNDEGIEHVIAKLAQSGDIVIFLGAGSVTYWARALPESLAELLEKQVAHS